MLKSLAAISSRSLAHIHFATAKALVPAAVAGLLLFGSQLVLAASPTADFDFSPGVGRVGQAVSFSATASDDDNDIVSVDWDFENDGNVDASGTDVQHTYSSSGTRTVRMIVTDATNGTAVVDHAIRVNSPPNAAFHHSPSNPTVGDSVSFDASDSTDDAALSGGGFAWDLDNDGSYDDATGRQVDQSFSTPGAKTVRLQVTDSEGEQSTTSDSVPVGPANSAPNAAFTVTPQRPNPNEGVTFNASGSTDDGPLLPTAYAWDLDGDGQFDDALGITPGTSYASGTRTVALRVTDVLGASDTASHTVTVNAPPSASFTFSPAAPEVGETVGFDAGASNDDLSLPNGAYGWDFDNNGSIDATGEQVQHGFATAGAKTVRLQVTDSGGLSTSTTRDLTVSALNTPPVPSFTFAPTRPNVAQSVAFDASATTDDATIANGGFAWDFDGDGSTDATGRQVNHSFASSGSKTASLRVTDTAGASATTTRNLTVNAPPVAAFNFSPSNPDVGDTVSLNASGSTDDLALPNSGYAWDLDNDGQYDDALGQTTTTAFTTSGSKTVRLQVTDSGGSTSVASQTIPVAANPPPTAVFTSTPARPNPNQVISYSAAGSTDDEAIPATGYAWDFDNDGQYDDATGVTATGSFATGGAKTVGLRVTDGDGATGTATATVTVNTPPVADFTFTPSAPLKDQQVRFTATATDDVALPATAYAWDLDNDNQFDDGTTAQVTTSYATAGAKVVRLRVTDSDNLPVTVTKTVNVNTLPTADFTLDPQTPRLNETVKFNSTSTDPDAGQTIAAYAWDLDGDGQFDDSTVAAPTSAYTSEGEKVVRLKVTDSAGGTSVREHRFVVADKIPDAAFRFEPAAPVPGETVTFTSTSVASAGSAIAKIEWNLDANSGFTRQGSVVTHAFTTAGVHTVEIKVTEDSGGVDIATAHIVVNAPPTALMRVSPAQPYTGDVVQFASLSSDPDGYLAAETWDLDGDGQYNDAGGRLASRAFTTVGAHTVRLRVVDGSGAGAVQAVTLNVRARPVAPTPPPEQLDPTVRITSRPGKRSTLITRLGIRAEKGAMVKAACKGKGCPRTRASSTRSRGKAMRLRWLERRLRAGTRIRIYITAKGKIGSYTSLLIRRSKHPSRRDLCLKLGTTRAMQCPS